MDGHETDRPGTPGGERRRERRKAAGRTQIWAEADLGTGYLRRLKSGKVVRPVAATLERIMAALEARFSERRDVLERFGCTLATPLPAPRDIAWAREESRRNLDEVAPPAYVLDWSHRLVAWNRRLPRLLGIGSDDPLLNALTRRSMIALWFDPASPLAPLVAEPEVFLPAITRAMRVEIQRFRTEARAAELIASHTAGIPRFRAIWEAVQSAPATASAERALVPVRHRVPDAGLLSVHLSSEPFARDARCRVISFFPAEPRTMRQCAAWADRADNEDGRIT